MNNHTVTERISRWTTFDTLSLGAVGGVAISIILSVALGLVILASGDSLIGAIALLGLIVVVFVTVYRLEWGVYLFIGTVLFIDQFQVPEFTSLTFKTNYFNNINIIPYLPRIEAAAFSPMDLHLVLLIAVWAAGLVLRSRTLVRPPAAWPIALLFLGWMALGFVSGAGRGGDSTAALWELRGLGYLFLSYFFISQIVRTEKQVRTFLWFCIGAIAFKALEGSVRFIGLGFSLGGHDALLTHEDPIFFITLWALLLGFIIFRTKSAQRTALIWLFIPLAIGFYAANRRAAFASLGAAILTIAFFVSPAELLRILKRSLPLLAGVLLYAAVFWGSSSPLAAPLNQIRSGFVDDEATLGERNYYSNLYRKLENFNLAFTVRSYPLAGIGFGTKYFQPLELVKIDFALRDYMAHNNILWLLVKVGGIGFFLFWLFVDLFAARASNIAAALRNPYLKAVGVMIVVAIINQLVAAYFDLHLVRYRTMTYLGALMGLLPALQSVLAQERKSAATGEHSEATLTPESENP